MFQHLPKLLALFLTGIFIGTACVQGTGTPAPVKEEALTASPTAESGISAGIPFAQSDSVFRHKSGSFSLPKLEGWKLNESEDGILFEYENTAQLQINVTNTGADLSHAALEVFAFGTEDALFVKQDDYTLLQINTDPEAGTIEMEKTFSKDGTEYYNHSIYYGSGHAVYMMSLTVESTEGHDYPFAEIFASIEFNAEKAKDLPLYQAVNKYTSPEGRFSIDIPLSWFVASASPNPQTVIETITPPDNAALIQVISFTNQSNWQPDQTDRAALLLVNEFFPFSANNIRVGFTQPPKDGKGRRMDWVSVATEYAGTLYVEAHGTQLLVLNLGYSPEGAEIYAPLMKRIADTISRP